MNDMIERYRSITGVEIIDQLYQLAYPLRGIKITHVNSTFTGGGVAEILTKMVPLTQALGIETRWETIQGSNEFFQCTKSFHNSLQGNKIVIPPAQLKIFEDTNRANAEKLAPILQTSDIVFIHDPQPVALIEHFPSRKGKWIWRCHIDASRPYRPVWRYLTQFIEQYDATIFSLADFTHPLSKPMFIIPPSIDPLSDKNIDLNQDEINQVYARFGIDPKRPLLLQVSRYDKFKDPLGVLDAYRLVKKFNPNVQLVLVGGEATDDPEGDIILKEVKNAAAGDPDVHILLLPPDAHRTINALQRAADIVLQKSTKEGFGLTVTEGLWKSKPVIGGNTGGIKLQVINGQTGFVVNTPEGAAYRTRYLLQHPEERREIGARGKEYVREKFLITRQIRDYLGLIYSLLFEESDRIELPRRR
jgi:trehalose synthase